MLHIVCPNESEIHCHLKTKSGRLDRRISSKNNGIQNDPIETQDFDAVDQLREVELGRRGCRIKLHVARHQAQLDACSKDDLTCCKDETHCHTRTRSSGLELHVSWKDDELDNKPGKLERLFSLRRSMTRRRRT